MLLILKSKFVIAAILLIIFSRAVTAQNLTVVINTNIPASGMNLTLDSVTFYGNATVLNISAMRDSVYSNWVYPDGYVTGASAIVAGVYKVGQQTGLDTSAVAKHKTFLSSGSYSLQAGDKIYRCYYTLTDSTYGTFKFFTLGYEDGSGNAKFEPFLFLAPAHHSDYIKIIKPGAAHDVEFEVSSMFGVEASGWGEVKITCSGETVVDCFGLVGGSASFLYDYVTTKECATVGNCCRCIFHFGFAYGFSSVGIGADGISIELSGSLGWKGSTEKEVKRCCPNGALVAFNYSPQTSGTSFALYSVSSVSNSVCWVAGSSATVLRTTDGGSNWLNASGTGLTGDIYCINAVDANTAFCSSSPSVTIIFKTINGGASWAPVFNQPGGFIDAIQMINPSTGYSVGDPVGGKWTVLKTTNSGNSWARMTTEPLQFSTEAGWNNSFQIMGNHMWFGTNSNRIYHSSDLGNTWNSSPSNPIINSYSVHFNSTSTGLAGGNGVIKSTNGGNTYAPVVTPSGLTEISGIDGYGPDWWAIGNGAGIYKSANAGAGWEQAYTVTADATVTLNAIDLSPSGSAGWVAGNSGEIIKISIQSQEATLNLKAFIEGFFNSGTNTQTGDTVTAYLRNTSSPYLPADSGKAFLNSSGNAVLNFPHVSSGNYYLVVKHRNSIETWSAAGIYFASGSEVNYDFSTLNLQAYGNNMKLKGTKWCIYSGDTNQDGIVDASDLSSTENDAVNSVSGYVLTDVTGDDYVDADDLSIVENNSTLGVTVIAP